MTGIRFFPIAFFLSLAFIGASIGLIYWKLFPEITQQFAVPLHYNIHFGVDLFGGWRRIFTIPTIGGIILAVNTLVSIVLFRKDRTLSYFFMTVATMTEVILFAAMVFVVLLNLSYYG